MNKPSLPADTHKGKLQSIRVVVADDHPVVRRGIGDELNRHPDIVVVSEAIDGDEALKLSRDLHPDVLVLDINMPGLQATQVVKQLLKHNDQTRVLVLSAYGDMEYVHAMLKAGATGYMLKDEDPSTIAVGVRAIARGETWLSSTVATSIVEYSIQVDEYVSAPRLSPREEEVLVLMAKGSTLSG